MNVQWYCKIAGRQVGPLAARQLKAMAEAGQISAADLVRREGDKSWVPAHHVKGLFPATPADSASRPDSKVLPVAKALDKSPSNSGIKTAGQAASAVAFDFSTLTAKPSGSAAEAAAHRPADARKQHQRKMQALAAAGVGVVAILGIGLLWVISGGEPARKPSRPRAVAAREPASERSEAAAPVRQERAARKPAGAEQTSDSIGEAEPADKPASSKKAARQTTDFEQPAEFVEAVEVATHTPKTAEEPPAVKAPRTAVSEDQKDSAAEALEESVASLPVERAKPGPMLPGKFTAPDEPVVKGKIEVAVRSVKVGPLPPDARSDSGQNASSYLLVALELHSTNNRHKVNFVSWSSDATWDLPVSLTDEAGNRYRQKVSRREPAARPSVQEAPHGPGQMIGQGQVIEANDFTFQAVVLTATTPVLVDFCAPWCGPCREMAPVIERLAGVNTGRLRCVKVNVDNAKTVAGKFNVKSIPCVVILVKGQVAERIDGFSPDVEQRLQQVIDQVAPKTPEVIPSGKKRLSGKGSPKKPVASKSSKRKTSKEREAEQDVPEAGVKDKGAPPASKVLGPNETIEDLLVFELPKPSCKRLKLELPAAAFGEKGSVEFEIAHEPDVGGKRPGQS